MLTIDSRSRLFAATSGTRVNLGDASAYARSFDVNGRLASYPLGNPAGTGAAAGVTRTLSYDNGLTHNPQRAGPR